MAENRHRAEHLHGARIDDRTVVSAHLAPR